MEGASPRSEEPQLPVTETEFLLVLHRRCRPAVHETGGKLGYVVGPSAQRSVFSWCERARQLVGPGILEHPRLCRGLTTAPKHES